MIYVEQPPSPRLSLWVRSLWYCCAPQIAHQRERVLPNGCMQLVLNLREPYLTECGADGTLTVRLPRALVVGARGRFEVIDTSDMAELVGVAFRPGGFARLFRERADSFFEQSIGLDQVWKIEDAIEQLSEATTPAAKLTIIDQHLSELVRLGVGRSEVVDQALYAFRDSDTSVRSCARWVGVSERRLLQVFREEVGLGPKMWCRIRRFQVAVRALHRGADVPWAEVAQDCGYYDQSHFANDFRAFSGIDPTTYCLKRGRWQNHVAIA